MTAEDRLIRIVVVLTLLASTLASLVILGTL